MFCKACNVVGLLLLASVLAACAGPTSTPGTTKVTPTSTPSSTAPAIPQKYQQLYTTLDGYLSQFSSRLDQRQSRHSQPIYGAHLLTANANRGTELLDGQALSSVKITLNRFQQLGIGGITLTISFPLLWSGYAQSSRYLEFYEQVAQEVRSRKMTLVVEQNMVFSNTAYSALHFDYSQFTLTAFTAADHQMAQTIIDTLAPDYLSILGEPDTYARVTGFKELATGQGATSFAKGVLASLNKKKTLVGAGTGSWTSPDVARSLAAIPQLDFLGIHIYPVFPQVVANAFTMADIAHQAGKKLVMDECWLYKTDISGTNQNGAFDPTIFKRDPYSFWQPLDQRFLATVVRFAQREDLSYISPFWTTLFFAYLPYNAALEQQSYAQQAQQFGQVAAASIKQGTFSSTGLAYRDLIRRTS